MASSETFDFACFPNNSGTQTVYSVTPSPDGHRFGIRAITKSHESKILDPGYRQIQDFDDFS